MESAGHRSFKDLECWKACRELRVFAALTVLPALPKDEKYRLGDQLIRAARSTTANIAEGYGRFHYLDTAKFSSNARGSAQEVIDHLTTAHDERLLDEMLYMKGSEMAERAIRLLNGYIRYLHELSRSPGAVREVSAPYPDSSTPSPHPSIHDSASEPHSPIPPSPHSPIPP